MARSVAERRVYLACRPIFSRETALVRKKKKIRELVEKHRTSLGPLVPEFGVEGLATILKTLLDARIFGSDLRAKQEFPELFPSPSVRDVQRAESEDHAVQSVAEAIEEIESLDQTGNTTEDENEGQPSQRPDRHVAETLDDTESLDQSRDRSGHQNDGEHPERLLGLEESVAGKKVPQHQQHLFSSLVQPVSDDVPSLYPSYIPYIAQHTILTTVQRILEECCFDFVKRWKPSILQNNGWDCAEAGELTKWTRIISKHSGKLPADAFTLRDGSSLNGVLFSTHKLRHSAVHRLRITARGVNQLIESARSLTEALQDPLRTAQLEELSLDVDSKIKAMELNKNVLEDEFVRQLQEIDEQRKALARKEKRLRADVRTEDLAHTVLVGSLLEETIKRIFSEDAKSHGVPSTDTEGIDAKTDVKSNGWNYYFERLAKPMLDLVVQHVSWGVQSPTV